MQDLIFTGFGTLIDGDKQEPVIAQQNDPPSSPNEGDRYLVGTTGTGDWEEEDNNIAEWDGSDWQFTEAAEDMIILIESEESFFKYDGSTWNSIDSFAVDIQFRTDLISDDARNFTVSQINTGEEFSLNVDDDQSAFVQDFQRLPYNLDAFIKFAQDHFLKLEKKDAVGNLVETLVE